MALAPNTPPFYPNVPKAPGVPPLMRQAGAIENTVVAVASDAISVVKQFLGIGPTWGIFSPKTGRAVFASDSVIAVDYRQEWRIADYPIERGGFVSYNKVKTPFDIRVSFSFTGNQGLLGSLIPGGALLSLIPGFSGADSRRSMLQGLDAAIAKLDLVSVVTPEAQYPSVNIIHYDYRREAHQGATLIKVDVWCQEVRPAPAAAFVKSDVTDSTDPLVNPGNAAPAGSGSGSADPGPGSGDGSKTGGTPGQTGGGNANAPKQPEGAASSNGGTVQPAQATPPTGGTTSGATTTGAGTGAQPGATTGAGQGGQGERQLLPTYNVGGSAAGQQAGLVEKGYEYTLPPSLTTTPPPTPGPK